MFLFVCLLVFFVQLFKSMAYPVSRESFVCRMLFQIILFSVIALLFSIEHYALDSRRLATIVFCLCNCFYRKLIHNLHIATEKNHNLTPFPSKHINIYSIKRPNKKPYGLQFHGLEFFFLYRFSSSMRSYGFHKFFLSSCSFNSYKNRNYRKNSEHNAA